MSHPNTTVANDFVSLTVDQRGRIVSLRNRITGTELIAFPQEAEAWRMVIPDGRHAVDFVYGSRQRPPRIELGTADRAQLLTLHYPEIRGRKRHAVDARFTLCLRQGDPFITASVKLANHGRRPVDEVEFPVLGGLGGFVRGRRRIANLITCREGAWIPCAFHGDVLAGPLPQTGRESDQFVREHETAMWDDSGRRPSFLDVYGPREGIYIGHHPSHPQPVTWKLERHPKGNPDPQIQIYPSGTPRWLRLWVVHVPQIKPGARWASVPVTLYPHAGDWHAAADFFRSRYQPSLVLPPTPAWMDDFVGWQEVLGKTYLGEIYNDFDTVARKAIADARVSGLNFLFYYGHTNIGAEGGDFDQSPARDLGGEAGFARMIRRLHKHQIRIMLLDHSHRYINRDVPAYRRLGLDACAVVDPSGKPVESRWWKETVLSCRRLEGPTPVWIEICPSCRTWQKYYRRHVLRMIERGVDGLELDCFLPSVCYSRDHAHAPGADMTPVKLDFIRRLREEARRLNPDFVFFCETMLPDARQACDGFYPNRYTGEDGRIYRYIFPEIRQQAVRVGNYAYDAVNKALMLGIGVETEIWGLRRTTAESCPELARYIGEINRFKRRYAHVLIRGVFRDTIGARVKGDVCYSVLESSNGDRALVLRNRTKRPVRTRAVLHGVGTRDKLRIWQPFQREKRVRALPVAIALKPYGVAVLVVRAAG